MKTIILLLIGGIIGYLSGHHNNSDAQVTYNALGHKVVVVTSDTERNAAISVGQECGEDGYSVIGTGTESDKAIMSAECLKQETSILSNWIK